VKKLLETELDELNPDKLKKRCNAYRLLMKPRSVARAEVIENSHPKM